jgi:ATP-binding cassette subfamily B protein
MLSFLQFMAGSLRPLAVPVAVNALALTLRSAPYLIVYFLLESFLRDGTASLSQLCGLGAILAVVLLAHYGAVVYYTRQSFAIAYHIIEVLRTRICDHLRRLPLSYFKRHSPADISASLLQDMADAENFFGLCIYEVTACVVVPLMLGIIMFCMDAPLALVMLLFVMTSLPFFYMTYLAVVTCVEGYVTLRSKVETAVVEYIGGIGEVKDANRTGVAFRSYTESNACFLENALKAEGRIGIWGELFQAILELGFVVCLAVGSYRLMEGKISLAVLLFFLLVGYRLVEPLQDLGAYFVRSSYYYRALKRVSKILYEDPLPVSSKGIMPQNFGFTFEHVNFFYWNRQVLHDVSFQVPEGSVTALVGESGSGKTTIANLLLRFWDVDSGIVSIGGADIRTLSLERLYDYFSVVFQDVYLFNDTVMNNIKMAKPTATDKEVLRAAELACCHNFVEGLEQGYETLVGDNGARLSGGERQRISIARAILKDAPVLILDEATASVDPENELQIQQGLTNLINGRTLLVIAHRLNTVARADQLLVLRQGRIEERGRHEELLAADGYYATLWRAQEQRKGWKIPSAY